MNILLINSFTLPISILRNALLKKEIKRGMPLNYPMSVMTLAAYVRTRISDINISILDANYEAHKYYYDKNSKPINVCDFIKKILDINEFEPNIVGTSILVSPGHTSSLMIAEAVKKKWPTAVTVMGGMHTTSFAHKLICERTVDFVIRGAGEIAFSKFVNEVKNSGTVEDIPGVVKTLKNIDTIAGPLGDITDLPMPAYDLIDIDYYARNDSHNDFVNPDTRIGHIQTSRGCSFKCTYCAANTVHGRKVKFRSIEKVIKEIQYLTSKFSINTIILDDDLFAANRHWFRGFFSHIEKENLNIRFNLSAGISVGIFNEETLDILTKNGLETAVLAIESASPYVQKNILKKNVDLKKAVRLAHFLHENGVSVKAYFILGSRGETISMMKETVEFAKRVPLDWVIFFQSFPLIGTEMCRQWIEDGVLTEDMLIDVWNNSDYLCRAFDTPEISAKDLERFQFDAYINVNFFNNYNMLHGHYDRAIKKFSVQIDKYPFQIVALACRSKCYSLKGLVELAKNDISAINKMRVESQEAKELYDRYQDGINSVINEIHNNISFLSGGVSPKGLCLC